MIDWRVHQGQLFLVLFAHFVIGSFSFSVVILDVWRLSIYYRIKKKAIIKCAFFIYDGKLFPWMDTNYIVDEITARHSPAVLLMVSNPVDVLTHVALKRSGFSRSRVIGSGTVLDSSRFGYLLSRHCDINTHNVHAYILGEHGDSEFAAWSMTPYWRHPDRPVLPGLR
jgi:hypothetical protein